MKRLCLLLLVLVTGLFCFSAAAAESEPADALNWSSYEEVLRRLGIDGDYFTLDEFGIKLWIPNFLKWRDLTEEEKEKGLVACFTTDTDSFTMTIGAVYTPGQGLEDYKRVIESYEDAPKTYYIQIGDFGALYHYSNDDSSLSFATTAEKADTILDITFYPVSEKKWLTYAWAIAASLNH